MTTAGIFLTLLIVCALIIIFGDDSAKKKPGKAKPKKTAAKPGQPVLVKSKQGRDPEQYEATGGAELPEVLAAAARLASEKNRPVKVGFSRQQYRVFPGGYFELTN